MITLCLVWRVVVRFCPDLKLASAAMDLLLSLDNDSDIEDVTDLEE